MKVRRAIHAFFANMPIRWKFMSAVSALIFSAILSLSYVFIRQAEIALIRGLEDKTILINRNFSIVAENALVENRFSDLQQLLGAVKADDMQFMFIANSNNIIIATSNPNRYGIFSKLDDPHILKFISKKHDQVHRDVDRELFESIRFIWSQHDNNSEFDTKIAVEHNRQLLGFIYIGLSTQGLKTQVFQLWLYSGIWAMAFLSLGIVAAFWIGSRMTRPIEHLARKVQKIASGNFNVRLQADWKDEIGVLISDVNSMRLSIKDLKENLEEKVLLRTLKLNEANKQLSKAMDALWGEMELAKKIQMALLPNEQSIPGYQTSALMVPAEEVGGDYYDIIKTENRIWFVIGDVSGHGVPAGLVMMMVQTAIQTAIWQNPHSSPEEHLCIVNRIISENIRRLNERKYMTITLLVLDQDGVFTFSGLHQDILIYRHTSQNVESIETQGMWLGIMDDIKGYNSLGKFRLEAGDTMLLYTDGITEAINGNGAFFGIEGLINLFSQQARFGPQKAMQSIMQYIDKLKRDDDVTMLLVKKE